MFTKTYNDKIQYLFIVLPPEYAESLNISKLQGMRRTEKGRGLSNVLSSLWFSSINLEWGVKSITAGNNPVSSHIFSVTFASQGGTVAEFSLEAQTVMFSHTNLLSPAIGDPISVPTQHMLIGTYVLTSANRGAICTNRLKKGEKALSYIVQKKGLLIMCYEVRPNFELINLVLAAAAAVVVVFFFHVCFHSLCQSINSKENERY
ncbi:hypothetical protein G4B88_004643 [Cannabis sativa]|uniref:DNA-directed RNA polymerase n=1 Tax=Cannabis sativa TaxID=3483 RepID=A0A7J6G4Z9_CANSA|nr:hypothetical protein G4B88_004643 [Cannabis sativa]